MAWIIGVLDQGPPTLTAAAAERLQMADLVIADDRYLQLYQALIPKHVETRSLTGKIAQVAHWIMTAQEQAQQVVVLTTGDPLFYGLGGLLAKQLPPDSFRVLGNVSTMQQAFERLLQPWQTAGRISVHTKDSGEWHDMADSDHALYPLFQALSRYELLGVLTSPANDPGRIARMLIALNMDKNWKITICQRLGLADEQIIKARPPQDVAVGNFSQPNVVILHGCQLTPHNLPAFGLPDDDYLKRTPKQGLITRREVRAVALAHLAIRNGDTIWDIGAGSGSVGLEAARLTPDGQVWAMEKNPEALALVQANRKRFNQYNYRVQLGVAPAGLSTWPDPDAVFIGGSGGHIGVLITTVLNRLKPGGRLVMNFVTLENQCHALACLRECHADWSMTQMTVATSRPLQTMHRLVADSPISIITVNKENKIS